MIPSAALTETLTITPFAGTSGLGVACEGYDIVTVPAAVEAACGRVTLPDGSTALAEARAYIRPGPQVPLLSRVVWRGRTYRVAGLELLMEPRGEAGVALTLVGDA